MIYTKDNVLGLIIGRKGSASLTVVTKVTRSTVRCANYRIDDKPDHDYARHDYYFDSPSYFFERLNRECEDSTKGYYVHGYHNQKISHSLWI